MSITNVIDIKGGFELSNAISVFGITVKKKLIEKSITISELAEALGCSRGHASRVINGKNDNVDTKTAICEFLGLSLKDTA